MDNIPKQRLIKVVLPLITLFALILAGYFYWQLRVLKQSPQAVLAQETADLIARVGKLVLLPVGETPTIDTVTDPQALKDQTFFASAQKGDEVLIYTQAKKVILYSVSLNKIINISSLSIGATAAPSAPAEPAPTTNTSTTTPKTKR